MIHRATAPLVPSLLSLAAALPLVAADGPAREVNALGDVSILSEERWTEAVSRRRQRIGAHLEDGGDGAQALEQRFEFLLARRVHLASRRRGLLLGAQIGFGLPEIRHVAESFTRDGQMWLPS